MRVTYITGTRADYGLMKCVLTALTRENGIDLGLVVAGMHFLPECGETVREIEADGWTIALRVPSKHSDGSRASMAANCGHFVVEFAQYFERHRPDLLLLLGDRDEQVSGAIAAAHLGVPIAHIHAGDRSGSLDDSNRHAIARYAHLHLAASRDAADRLIRTGEEPYRVHLVGSPTIDDIASSPVGERPMKEPYLLWVQHPVVSEAEEAGPQMEETLAALETTGLTCLAFAPNSDAGFEAVREVIRRAVAKGIVRLVTHLGRDEFVRHLRHAEAIVGNSSAGIIEASYLAVPCVDIGSRQAERLRGLNVLWAPYERHAIGSAFRKIREPAFRIAAETDRNIYGTGNTSAAIIEAIRAFPWSRPEALRKRISY